MATSNTVEIIFSSREYDSHNLKIKTILKSKKNKFKSEYIFLKNNFKSSYIKLYSWSDYNGWNDIERFEFSDLISKSMDKHIKNGVSHDTVDEIEEELDKITNRFFNNWS